MTLIEVLVALTILSLMMIMAWQTTSSSATTKRRVEAIQERQHELRVAMNRLVRDISSAYISTNERVSAQESTRRTVFLGADERPVDELRFSSMGHRVLWADANESEQTMISYFADQDPEDSSKTNLLRRESRRLSSENWEQEPADVDILLRDIQRVEFEYFDWKDNEWQGSWNSDKADEERSRLPERVRITITILNDQGDEIKRTTQARIMLQEALSFRPQ